MSNTRHPWNSSSIATSKTSVQRPEIHSPKCTVIQSVSYGEKRQLTNKKERVTLQSPDPPFPETSLFRRRSGLQTCFVNIQNASAYLNKFQVPYAIRQLTFHCNQYQTSKRSRPISEDESQKSEGSVSVKERDQRRKDRAFQSRWGQNADLPTFCEGLGLGR